MKYTLYLASQSQPRQKILNEIGIPFTLVPQDADEHACDWGLPLQQLVASIALHKMEHAVLPDGKQEGEVCFVLTADTLSQDMDGTVQGKPVDRADAIVKLKKARDGSRLCTGFCLDKRIWKNGTWEVAERVQKEAMASYHFIVPDEWIDRYLEHSTGLKCSNAIAVDDYGYQFLKEVGGSYTAIIGLPVLELREVLEKMGYFEK